LEEKKTVLSVKNLSVSFTQYELWIKKTTLLAVKDVSLTVREGELVAVVGSSGSGKSLLAHGVLGILPYNAAWSGEISYYGPSKRFLSGSPNEGRGSDQKWKTRSGEHGRKP